MLMEKQNTVENQLAHTITQTEFDSDYDKTAKKLLANKQILAQLAFTLMIQTDLQKLPK